MVAGRPGIRDSRHADNLPAWFLALADVAVWFAAFAAAAWLALSLALGRAQEKMAMDKNSEST